MYSPLIFFGVHVYLDPGSGSIILQLVIAGLLGVGVALGAFWRKIKALFHKKSSEDESPADDA